MRDQAQTTIVPGDLWSLKFLFSLVGGTGMDMRGTLSRLGTRRFESVCLELLADLRP